MRPREPGSIQAKQWFGSITPYRRSTSGTTDVSVGCSRDNQGHCFSNRPELVIVPVRNQEKWSSINVGQGLASPVRENRGAVRSRNDRSARARGRQAGGSGLARQRLSRRLCLGHGDLVLSGRGRDQRGRARGLDLGQVRPHPRQDRGRLDRRSRQTTRSVMSALRGKLQGSGDAEE